MKKLFIVFEGIDGSGSSTQATLLHNYFINQGDKAILSPEPSDGAIGKFIREALQKQIILIKNSPKFDEQMAYLFAADRHYHLYNDVDGVLKSIHQDHCHVITTRYYFSSLAYNSQTPEEFEFVKQLNQRFPDPDLVIYLDLPVEIALERLKERACKEVYEVAEKLTLVRTNFLNIFSQYDKLWLKLDATHSPEAIHQQIVQYLKTHF